MFHWGRPDFLTLLAEHRQRLGVRPGGGRGVAEVSRATRAVTGAQGRHYAHWEPCTRWYPAPYSSWPRRVPGAPGSTRASGCGHQGHQCSWNAPQLRACLIGGVNTGVRGQGEPLPGGRATKLISCSALSQAAHCQAAAELDGMLMVHRRAVLG